jgi:glutamate-1-semialdehyde aminotransferase
MEIMIHSKKVLSWITCKKYIAPSAYESWFITDALSYEDLDFTIRAVDKVSKTFCRKTSGESRKFFFTD